jgi:glycosyltransferase involved in cell wall biosynthesis
VTRDARIVLAGQGRWSRALAAGLEKHAGLRVDVAAFDGLADAVRPASWRVLLAADTIVRIGFRPAAATWRGALFDASLRLAQALGHARSIVYFWIGSDVRRAAEDLSAGRNLVAFRRAAASGRHLAGSEPLRRDLSGLGVDAVLVPFPWELPEVPTPPPLPDRFSVLSYVPDARSDFYGGPDILDAARALPDVRFVIMGGDGTWAVGAPANVRFAGWVAETAPLYAEASCVVRSVRFDSVGGTAVEGLAFGRPVIYSCELEHTAHVPFGDTAGLIAAVRELHESHLRGDLAVDKSIARWARKRFDPHARFLRFAEVIAAPEVPRSADALRVGYLTLQSTEEGQAGHAHVLETVRGLRDVGIAVDLFEPSYRDAGASSALRRLAEFLRLQFALVRTIRLYDALYVRAHFAAWPVSAYAKLRRVPVIQEVNGPYSDLFAAWPWTRHASGFFTWLQRSQYRMASRLVAVTDLLAHGLTDELGRTDVTTIGNGANTDMFRPDARHHADLPARYACFFGALAPWQGIAVMLAALDEPAWPAGLPIVLAGDGAEAPAVRAASARDPRVVYLGRRPYSEVPGIIAQASCGLCVQDATARGATGLSPLKLYEMMAAGVPVVVSDVPGLRETVTSAACGLIVPPGDSRALAEAVAAVIADPVTATEMGERGRSAAVREHSWTGRARQTARCIRETVAERRPRP